MKSIDWTEFFERLNKVRFESFDLIIAIADGGIIPAAFIQQRLNIPMRILKIEYRDENNTPKFSEPKLTQNNEKIKGKKILIVDDVSRSGKTLKKAKVHLKGNEIKTFVINGKADFSLFDEKECILMPWKKMNNNQVKPNK